MDTYAVIDLGSNTFHLLIAKYKEGVLLPIFKKRFFTKLSDGGVDFIKPERYQQGLSALHEFSTILETYHQPQLRVIGTAVLRQAQNRHDFIYEAERILNATIEIIDGDLEADFIFKGVTLLKNVQKGQHLIMDIGGGSTEFIIVNDGQKMWSKSFHLGIGFLHSKFHDDYPLSSTQLDGLKEYIIQSTLELKNEITQHNIQSLVGASGSFEILQSMLGREPSNTDLDPIDISDLENIYNLMSGKNLEELFNLPGLPRDRAKLAMTGMTLMKTICDEMSIPLIQVSPFALKEGVIRDMAETEDLTLQELIAQKKGTVVDVRTYQEYLGGHVVGSILVPLNELERKLDELRSIKPPLILVCRTGNRSGQALEFLKKEGLSCVNGGAWTDVNFLKSTILE